MPNLDVIISSVGGKQNYLVLLFSLDCSETVRYYGNELMSGLTLLL